MIIKKMQLLHQAAPSDHKSSHVTSHQQSTHSSILFHTVELPLALFILWGCHFLILGGGGPSVPQNTQCEGAILHPQSALMCLDSGGPYFRVLSFPFLLPGPFSKPPFYPPQSPLGSFLLCPTGFLPCSLLAHWPLMGHDPTPV